MPSTTDPVANKDVLWDWWKSNARWREQLHKKAAYKSLDIDEEPMISANRQVVNGIGWKELAVVAATGLGIAYYMKADPPKVEEKPPAVEAVETVDRDTITDVSFPE